MVNGPNSVYIERDGRSIRSMQFNDLAIYAVIDRIVGRVGRRIDESSP